MPILLHARKVGGNTESPPAPADVVRLSVPADLAAEHTVAAVAAESRAGARLAVSRLVEADFYDLAAGRVLRAVSVSRQHLREVELAAPVGRGREARIVEVARLADLDVDRLHAWRDEAPVAVDIAGTYSRRVRAASVRRQLVEVAGDMRAAAAAGDLDAITQARARLDQITAELSAPTIKPTEGHHHAAA